MSLIHVRTWYPIGYSVAVWYCDSVNVPSISYRLSYNTYTRCAANLDVLLCHKYMHNIPLAKLWLYGVTASIYPIARFSAIYPGHNKHDIAS